MHHLMGLCIYVSYTLKYYFLVFAHLISIKNISNSAYLKVDLIFFKRKPWTMRNVVGMASVASKWKNSAFEQDSCRRVMGEEERGVHILLRYFSSFTKI